MYRITITYPTTEGAGFDWTYYMNNHLPLAVGTSMRHSDLNFCDADRPLNSETPHAAVCMVHFDSANGMRDFCDFFVKGHPDSEKIGADEINYTTIKPGMTTAECEDSDGPMLAPCRIKIFFPCSDKGELSRQEISDAQSGILEGLDSVSWTETDFCLSGLAQDSRPDYSLIWTLNFDDREKALEFNEDLSSLEALCHAKAQLMVSEVMTFDLSLTAAYR